MAAVRIAAAPLLWAEADACGQKAMDRDHAACAALYRTALAADEAAFPAAYRAFCRHLAEHFAEEERLMRAAGFPPHRIHAAEHRSALAACEKALARGQARDFLEAQFPLWFRHHLATMDRVTARFLNGEEFAGCARMGE
jgi:hemerythrin